MKHVQLLAILLGIAFLVTSCNKNESNSDSISIIGGWEVLSFIIGNQSADYFDLLNAQAMFYSFEEGGALELFIAKNELPHDIENQSYSFDEKLQEITFNTGASIFTASVERTGNNMTFNGEDNLGNTFKVELILVDSDLCDGLDCNGGVCYFGYCVCDQNSIGLPCDVELGPAGGIVILDKGFVSQGFRYIEASRMSFTAQSTSCLLWKGETGLEIGDGMENTNLIAQRCSKNENAANTCWVLKRNGFDDWLLPSKDELNLVIPYADYFIDPNDDGFFAPTSSSINSKGDSWRLVLSNGNQWIEDNVPTEFIAVRYY